MTAWIRRCPVCDYANSDGAHRCHCCQTLLTAENDAPRHPGARHEPAPSYPALDSFTGRHPVQAMTLALIACLMAAVALVALVALLH